MLSFFGEQCLKDAVVERVREHQRLDQIIQGKYWEQCDDGVWRGCAIGCVLHSSDHRAYERQLGLPVFLAYIDEHIFESLPKEEAKFWPLRFIESVPVGVDLELVFPKFMHWVLSDPQGVRQHADARTLPIFDALVEMYDKRIAGVPFDQSAAWAAAWAATEAAGPAAEAAGAAAEAAARTAAEAAARAAAESAAEAAWAAAEAAARAATEAAAWAARAAAWADACVAAGAAVAAAAEAARAAARTATRATRAAAEAAKAAAIYRQADYLISLLQAYESKPIESNLSPCAERYAFLQQPI
jgi:hypothetical protein